MGRGRKVEMGRKIKMGPKEMKERHDLAMAKYYESLNKSELKDSELEDNDWISLYLKLAVATTNKSFDVARLSLANLKILKVATESTQGLGDYDAVFYIEYEDSCEARVGKDVHRVAIVRRILDKQSEVLCLLGHNQSINNSAAMEAGSSSAQD
ncbi:unnamed protein product [Brassica oleracea var. botrytis]|uniref:(rape) hypothetical protein n=1 Tax=Brassica napus TaxID=3708 RepID=A0A816MPQ4_BRANA|nr:unnamed protein product [Brassica napus]